MTRVEVKNWSVIIAGSVVLLGSGVFGGWKVRAQDPANHITRDQAESIVERHPALTKLKAEVVQLRTDIVTLKDENAAAHAAIFARDEDSTLAILEAIEDLER
jgi:hypothetical protein